MLVWTWERTLYHGSDTVYTVLNGFNVIPKLSFFANEFQAVVQTAETKAGNASKEEARNSCAFQSIKTKGKAVEKRKQLSAGFHDERIAQSVKDSQ